MYPDIKINFPVDMGKRKNVPNCLKKYRKARGFQQKDVAKILGLKCTSMISRWEKGFCLPSAVNLFKLAVLYRTIADSLFIDLLKTLKVEINKREEKVSKRLCFTLKGK
jgi:transcriptional regulator with XRE-family HTH domain